VGAAGLDRSHLGWADEEERNTVTVFAVLLRAVNVGGRNKVPMAELRELLGDLGFDEVATYIQSGNVVCSSSKKAPAVANTIKQAIADTFGHDIAVIVRTASEIAALIDTFPYPNADPKASGVVFLAAAFDGELDASKFAPDECQLYGSNVFVNCPTRFADTKLTGAWVEKQTGLAGTRRNWATVLKLHAMTRLKTTNGSP